MDLKRVVITGLGAISPFGRGIKSLKKSIFSNKSAISIINNFKEIKGLRSHVGGVVKDINPKEIPRKYRRAMSPMSIYAALAAKEALLNANLSLKDCSLGKVSLILGSTTGSVYTMEQFFKVFLQEKSIEKIKSTLFFQIMNHSCAANVGQFLGITGRTLAPAAACSTSCIAIGQGFELISKGMEDIVICGGADELHPLTVATFDIMNAASTKYNFSPHNTPRPFDINRDGVVCSEGSGILILESLESAKKRKANIYAEILAFSSNTDPSHIANPSTTSLKKCLQNVLKQAKLTSQQIDYLNAHATGTIQGDIVESNAIYEVLGTNIPVSSLKGHLGHTMAASGALEIICCIFMLQENKILPTRNLEQVDPQCSKLKYVQKIIDKKLKIILKNNFALGGINSSLILRRYEEDD
ncbi:3-oxoacyl-[acyl-carrier-protein] synthase II [Desulfonauticus submarinus]|uniref:3-oxoacyl-[acyl-carrier-protein] synthase II n=1 Tax=Desulfonauticus submarinus TaxID=206665 RepID=A0A1H0FT51_9BACT|nr:beta-ketoacyl-[acyl-carrier-protein] synthase family protein [Desulfonauticus submarinus]SDN97817.1 3-oxoacyl-[acyl-carrier-protein] synthase II [Desulfonauticus submarinus]